MRFQALLRAVIGLIQSEKRVTYRTLNSLFGLDDSLLDDIRKELGLRHLAIDENRQVLLWAGETQPAGQPAAAINSQPLSADTTPVPSSTEPVIPPPGTKLRIPFNEPTVVPEAMSTDMSHEEPTIIPEPIHTAPEAERRQLTVMFCDLADSTQLS